MSGPLPLSPGPQHVSERQKIVDSSYIAGHNAAIAYVNREDDAPWAMYSAGIEYAKLGLSDPLSRSWFFQGFVACLWKETDAVAQTRTWYFPKYDQDPT